MTIDPIRKLLEDADLRALIDDVEEHSKLDHVVIVTLKTRRTRSTEPKPARSRDDDHKA